MDGYLVFVPSYLVPGTRYNNTGTYGYTWYLVPDTYLVHTIPGIHYSQERRTSVVTLEEQSRGGRFSIEVGSLCQSRFHGLTVLGQCVTSPTDGCKNEIYSQYDRRRGFCVLPCLSWEGTASRGGHRYHHGHFSIAAGFFLMIATTTTTCINIRSAWFAMSDRHCAAICTRGTTTS